MVDTCTLTEVIQYQPSFKIAWNNFVRSHNLPFFFQRAYMEYHADRFIDFSLMYFYEGELLAIFPANKVGKILYSHQGLTFGGIQFHSKNTDSINAQIVNYFSDYLKENGFNKINYKPIPKFISSTNGEHSFLQFENAKLLTREVNLVIPACHKGKIQLRRKRGYKKALKAGLVFTKSNQWETFWELLEENLLKRHHCRPIHTLNEILLLKQHFPENIQLYVSKKDDQLLAGAVVFFYNTRVAHCQYLVNSEEGRRIGALDFVIFELKELLGNRYQLSLGVSTLRATGLINKGLYDWKAGFGALPQYHDNFEVGLD